MEETRTGAIFLHTKTHYTRKERRKGGKKGEKEERIEKKTEEKISLST